MWSLMQGMLILYYGDSNELAIFWVFLFSLLGSPKMISNHKKHQNSHKNANDKNWDMALDSQTTVDR